MASPIKACSFFYNGKRVGVMQDVEYEIDTGDGQEMTDDGSYFTDGRTTAKVTCNVLVPIAGIRVSVIADALGKKDSKISIGIVDGGIHEMDARLKTGKFKGEVANGKLTGGLEFMCKEPTVTG